MDDQNLIEKLGIVRDLSEIKLALARIEILGANTAAQVKEHHEALFGNGSEPGLKTTTDRLNELEKGKQARWTLAWTVMGALIMERGIALFSWIVKRGP